MLVCNARLSAGDRLVEGYHFWKEPAARKAANVAWASSMMLAMGLAALGALAAHGLAIALWRTLRWTKSRPLPDFLVWPVPELLLANLLVLPLAMASTLLLMQVNSAGRLALGCLGMALLLAYLLLVAAVLLGVSAKRQLLGLRYVETYSNGATNTAAVGACPSMHPPYDSKWDGHLHSGDVAELGTSKHSLASWASSARSLLLRVAPPHRAGYWERPDVVLQQELRRAYQGACVTCIAAAHAW